MNAPHRVTVEVCVNLTQYLYVLMDTVIVGYRFKVNLFDQMVSCIFTLSKNFVQNIK